MLVCLKHPHLHHLHSVHMHTQPFHMANAYSPFSSQATHHFLRKTFPDTPPNNMSPFSLRHSRGATSVSKLASSP